MPLVTRQQQQRAAEAGTARMNAHNRTKRRFQEALDDMGVELVEASTLQPTLSGSPAQSAQDQEEGA